VRPFRKLISIEEALDMARSAIEPVTGVEVVRVAKANGRVVAKDVQSRVDVPPFDRAAMDGYAVRAEDTFGAGRAKPLSLDIAGVIYAGRSRGGEVESGRCFAIATGAVMPGGADAVVMVENTEKVGDRILVMKPVYPGENVSKQGEDIGMGEVVLSAGDVINPARIGSLSAVGLKDLAVYVRPRVTVVPTGEEIAEPGEELEPGQIYNVNAYTLAPLIEDNGCEAVVVPVVEDTMEAIEGALEMSLGSEMVVFTGGSSVGERDLMFDLIDKHGEVLFHGIMVKPGKPTILGKVEDSMILGMPGYPTSCLSNGYLILEPMLRELARLPARRRERIELTSGQRIVSTIGRHQFFPVKVKGEKAVPAFKESGAITSMSEADGYIEIPADVDLVEKGEVVLVTLF
jgi:molybdenum cofactor synthesis domain-containing protein